MSHYPHVRAAFINVIAEEGTKQEAIAFLQAQWNETCALRAALRRMLTDPPATLDEPDTDADVIMKMRAIARAALKGEQT